MRNLLIIFYIGLLTSCSYPFWVKPKYFTELYNGKSTGIDTLIEVVGFYKSEIIVPQLDTSNIIDKDYIKSMGAYVELCLIYTDGSILMTRSGTDIEKQERDIDNDSVKHLEAKQQKKKYRWGTYVVVDDTIKSQIITDFGFTMTPGVFERKFIIESDTVIRMIYEKELSPEYPPNKIKGNGLFHFCSYSNRIDSLCNPYLNKKWFWKDKIAYEKYRKNRNSR